MTETRERTNSFETGLLQVLTPAVETCDEQIREVLKSQESLGNNLDRLASALQEFTEKTKMPPVTKYTEKLSRARKRLKTVNTTVEQINNRLENIRSIVRKKEQLEKFVAGESKTSKAPPSPVTSVASLIDLLSWDDKNTAPSAGSGSSGSMTESRPPTDTDKGVAEALHAVLAPLPHVYPV